MIRCPEILIRCLFARIAYEPAASELPWEFISKSRCEVQVPEILGSHQMYFTNQSFLAGRWYVHFTKLFLPLPLNDSYVHENLRITVTWLKFHLSRSAIAHVCSVSFGLFFWVLGNSFALAFASWRVGPNAYLRYLTSSWRLLTCLFSLIFFVCLLVFFFQYILGDSKWYVKY